MALYMPVTEPVQMSPYVEVQARAEAPRARLSYRCQGCGSELAFDALAALCRCSDECYAEASAPSPVARAR